MPPNFKPNSWKLTNHSSRTGSIQNVKYKFTKSAKLCYFSKKTSLDNVRHQPDNEAAAFFRENIKFLRCCRQISGKKKYSTFDQDRAGGRNRCFRPKTLIEFFSFSHSHCTVEQYQFGRCNPKNSSKRATSLSF